MVRALDVATQTAVRNRSSILIRNLVLIDAKNSFGDVVRFGFTDWGEDISINILDGRTLSVVNRTFYGDAAPLLAIDPIPLKIGIEIPTVQVTLSQIHNRVQDMVRNHDIRNVQAQIHRAYLDPESRLPVANPRCRLLGMVNGAPINTPSAGGTGSIILKVVSHTRELTRTNPAKRSDETQRLRSNDRFRRYGGVAGEWDIFWGEKSSVKKD